MKIRFTKYAISFLFAFMGIYISISGHNILFGFIGGIGIGLALKMAYDAGKESNKL
jgi:hypothetical protein